jgi:hypothetical protein
MPTIKQSKAAAKVESRRQKEEQMRRAERRTRLKRRGVLAALVIAATLAVVLLIAKWNKPTDTDNASPKDASAVYEKSTGASVVEQSAGQAKISADGVGNVAGRQGNGADLTALPKADNVRIDVLTINGKKYYGVKINTDDKDKKEEIIDSYVDYAKDRGVKVEESGIGSNVKGQRPVPSKTLRVYRNASPQTDEKEPSR